MTQYREHWEAADINDDPPAGWTKRWAAASSPASFVRRVVIGTPPFKRRYIETSQSAGTYGAISMDAVDADADRDDVEVLALYTVPDADADVYAAIVLRGSGAAGSENGYYFGLIPGSNQIDVGSLVAGVAASIAAPSVTLTPGESYLVRASIVGTTIRARVWNVNDPEPAAWLVDGTTSAVAGVGWVGFWNLGNGKRGAWNFFTVGTGTDNAPMPVMNSAYAAWLANGSNPRAVAADLKALGYIAGGVGSPLQYDQIINARASTYGYTSKPYDSPPSTHYPPIIKALPTFRREMPIEFNGKVTTGFGEVKIFNNRPPGSTSVAAGERDDWLRMRWLKSNITLRLGDPDWSLHDFRTVLVGKLGQPTAPEVDVIQFPVEDLSGLFDVPITTERFTSGPYAGQFKPRLFGRTQGNQLEPPLISSTDPDYYIGTETDGQLADNAQAVLVDQVPQDNGLADTDLRILSVNTATDTIKTSANHGFTAGWRLRFLVDPDPVPAPLVEDTDYYVISAGLTADEFRLSTTPGGAAINLTGTDTNGLIFGYGWSYDPATSILSMVNNVAGRLTVRGAISRSSESGLTSELYNQIVFRSHGLGLSANYKDPSAFDALAAKGTTQGTAAMWCDTTQTTVAEQLRRLAAGTFTWFGLTTDALFQVGQIGLPESTAVLSLTESDVADLAMTQVIRPKNFATAQVSYQPWFLTGPQFDSTDPVVKQGKSFLAPYSYAGTVPPLDNNPTLGDTEKSVKIDFLTSGTQSGLRNHLATLYALPLGVFEFKTTLRASELAIGQTIELVHSRLGWRNWTGSGDNPSPDNTSAFDATKAVVIGIDTNLSADADGVTDPFPVRLKVFRQLPGYYPESDITP